MKSVIIDKIVYWIDPENNDIITPDKYPQHSHKNLIMVVKKEPMACKVILAYCPLHQQWEEVVIYGELTYNITLYAKNCEEMYNLRKIAFQFEEHIERLVKGIEINKTHLISDINTWIKKKMRKIKNAERDITVKYIFDEIVETLDNLAYFFNIPEIKEIANKTKIKLVSMRLKGGEIDESKGSGK
ncbi:MAG: hypothetical protein QXS74_06385 [Nitrososphaeria archaeon]